MTHATRDFVWIMRIYALIYFVLGVFFFFMPGETFYLINIGPRVLKIYEEIPLPTESFWLVLATAMMMMLTFCAIYSSLYPQIKGFVVVHMVSKFTSVACFIYLFLQKKYFAYLLGAVADSSVVVVVLAFYLRSLTSRDPASALAAAPPTTTQDAPADSHQKGHDDEPAGHAEG